MCLLSCELKVATGPKTKINAEQILHFDKDSTHTYVHVMHVVID